ncbi:CHASE3 domain-containing protein [Caldimonas sp. KR1-144]|uniref:CHASE3 domain-containing protein n=1 Tax=Caldimonas sp. KR1-144 TaxID=3400911 RepID=UPI003C086450
MAGLPERLRRLTRSRLAAPIALAFAVIVVTINEIGYQRVRESTQARDEALQVRVVVNRLRLLVADAESAQRGFLLTQRDDYKEPYSVNLGELLAVIERVKVLAAQRPAHRESLEMLAAAAEKKLDEMREVIRLVEAGQRDNALSLLLTDIGREQMVVIDRLVAQVAAAETAAFTAAGEQRDRAMMIGRVGIAVLVLLCLAAVFTALRLAHERERERLERQAELQGERDKLESEVESRTRELTELANHLQTVREDERSHLARELHDELGGLLTAAKLDVARVKNRLGPATSPEVAERLAHLVKSLDAGIALKRRIIEDLRPSSLSNLGLNPALQILCAEFAKRSEIQVDTRLDEVRLPPNRALSVYRLVQEALTNVAKYAQARRVEVSLEAADGRVVVRVTDDGRGFDTAGLRSGGHGLAGMRFRMRSAGGAMVLSSAPGRGTVIEATLPLS